MIVRSFADISCNYTTFIAAIDLKVASCAAVAITKLPGFVGLKSKIAKPSDMGFCDGHHGSLFFPRIPCPRVCESKPFPFREQMSVLIAVGIGFAVTVGMWLLGT
jgi:hypothetical protein